MAGRKSPIISDREALLNYYNELVANNNVKSSSKDRCSDEKNDQISVEKGIYIDEFQNGILLAEQRNVESLLDSPLSGRSSCGEQSETELVKEVHLANGNSFKESQVRSPPLHLQQMKKCWQFSCPSQYLVGKSSDSFTLSKGHNTAAPDQLRVPHPQYSIDYISKRDHLPLNEAQTTFTKPVSPNSHSVARLFHDDEMQDVPEDLSMPKKSFNNPSNADILSPDPQSSFVSISQIASSKRKSRVPWHNSLPSEINENSVINQSHSAAKLQRITLPSFEPENLQPPVKLKNIDIPPFQKVLNSSISTIISGKKQHISNTLSSGSPPFGQAKDEGTLKQGSPPLPMMPNDSSDTSCDSPCRQAPYITQQSCQTLHGYSHASYYVGQENHKSSENLARISPSSTENLSNEESFKKNEDAQDPSVSNKDNLPTGIGPEQGSYPCPHCEKHFAYTGNLKRHIKMHHGAYRPYKCNLCVKRFWGSDSLEQHYKRVHSNNKPYACAHCEKKYSVCYDLQKHVRSVHGKDIDWEMSVPSKAGPSEDDQGVHRKKVTGIKTVHLGQLNYKCKFCNRGFATYNGLGVHLKMHFRCRVCLKGFNTEDSLKTHIKKAGHSAHYNTYRENEIPDENEQGVESVAD